MKKYFKVLLSSSLFVVLLFLYANTTSAATINHGEDSDGTYSEFKYSAEEIQDRIDESSKTLSFYQSNAYDYAALIASGIVGAYTNGYGATIFGASAIETKSIIQERIQSNISYYEDLMTTTNTTSDGVIVKRYYSESYQTGLGMVKDYYGDQIISAY
ncbi:hypothetical protein ACE1TI_08780 [Alteribacillus sp. JSM 102045]|uniref:hypothetical protein n=1 Tax=Alteribacillus sp. JSM 102045 TaxID=1562101 RepID=UPI0035C0A259